MTTTRRQVILCGAALAAAAALPRLEAASMQRQAIASPGNQALAEAVSLSDFEAVAEKRMTHMAWEYINSGAADQITLRWNREAFDKLRLNPRVLRDVSQVDTKVKVLGHELPFPVMLAPTALHKLAHPEGELATAK